MVGSRTTLELWWFLSTALRMKDLGGVEERTVRRVWHLWLIAKAEGAGWVEG
jgi:hypothetical protein